MLLHQLMEDYHSKPPRLLSNQFTVLSQHLYSKLRKYNLPSAPATLSLFG